MSLPTASEVAGRIGAAAEEPVVVSLQNVSVRYRLPREPVHSIKDFAIRWLKRKIVYD